MRKAAPLLLVLSLFAPPACAGFGMGMHIGYQDPGFDLNFTGSYMLNQNVDISGMLDLIMSGGTAGMFTGNFKYIFSVPGVNPYAGLGLGVVFGGGTAFAIPFHVGVSFPVGSGLYIDADVRPVLFISNGTYFSFGFLAGVIYYF